MFLPDKREFLSAAAKHVARRPWVHGRLKFDLRGDGFILIDGGQVCEADEPADLVVTANPAALFALARGHTTPLRAYMVGQIQFSDMNLALVAQHDFATLLAEMT